MQKKKLSRSSKKWIFQPNFVPEGRFQVIFVHHLKIFAPAKGNNSKSLMGAGKKAADWLAGPASTAVGSPHGSPQCPEHTCGGVPQADVAVEAGRRQHLPLHG